MDTYRLRGRIKRRSTTIYRLISALCRAKDIGRGLLVLSVLVSADIVLTPVQSGAAGAHQSGRGAENNPTEKQPASDRERALQMLDPLFEAISKLDPDLTRIYCQTRIADALWEYDEPRARSRFEAALRTCELLKVDLTGADSRSQYRGDVLEAIKQHDPSWARKLALDNWHSTKKQEPDMWTLLLLSMSIPNSQSRYCGAKLTVILLRGSKAIWRDFAPGMWRRQTNYSLTPC